LRKDAAVFFLSFGFIHTGPGNPESYFALRRDNRFRTGDPISWRELQLPQVIQSIGWEFRGCSFLAAQRVLGSPVLDAGFG
jgi:hypothetical protein